MIANYIAPRRWFRAKARGLVSATIDETFPLELAGERVELNVVACAYRDGGSERYVVPAAIARGPEANRLRAERPHLVIEDDGDAVTYDALGSERLLAALLDALGKGMRVAGPRGTLVMSALPGFSATRATSFAPRVTTTEQSNTSIVYGDAFVLKVLRQLDAGASAELETGAFLTEHGYTGSPPLVGSISIERPGASEPWTVAVLHRFVPNQGDAWTATLARLAASPEPDRERASRLGRRIGEMHAVLASAREPAFAPQPIRRDERRKLADAVLAATHAVAQHLGPQDLARMQARLDSFVGLTIDPNATRIHGDLHLGQILVADDDFAIIDFEGEPSRPLAERKARRSPLADAAGMLRSFHYAACTALRASPDAAHAWYVGTADAFLASYRDATRSAAVLAVDDDAFQTILAFYMLEKCVYEIAYEANNRPDWLDIPRRGLADLLRGA